MTNKILKIMAVRDRLFARKKREPENLTILNAYKRVRNKVSNEIKKAKNTHYKNYFVSHCNNIKKTWEGI